MTTVRFGAPAPPRSPHWRSTLAVLLTGCCVAAFPVGLTRSPVLQLSAATPKHTSAQTAASLHVEHHPAPLAHRAIVRERPQTIRIVLPPPAPITGEVPVVAIADPPPAPAAVKPNAPESSAAKAEADTLRPVDVAQISDSDVRSLRVPELHEPGLTAGGESTLTTKIAAMQVTPLPPARLRDSDRAVLLAEAPTQMTVRIGHSALGKVDFHMTDARTIDVKLGNLLDLLAGQYDAAEFARLRASPAADAYVSFDQLRALGLNVRYDPAYDELRING